MEDKAFCHEMEESKNDPQHKEGRSLKLKGKVQERMRFQLLTKLYIFNSITIFAITLLK